ncbi:MAG: tRNA pseudouridine55 synthase [Acetobacterium sp.]|jgi:tRNA pseudouridine55 synthase|uniref:tRNA pseudouridine(55) synthase TruB n=1 Tax=unclassified Acetobacterium TaxID=2638182 RepID=UPI000DBEC98D|nr:MULTISPECIES: tRNA pseudouridine(55) synthase TruB [unclassified Acetobacterium]AWW25684.1 tRNA pseudouridine(55) synthase TruB [Acetobacterium sp. KB-1]MDK2941459.1 tRNA pseudouridine55 synthase [Acetobacterium sp.]MDZ5724640.1 tRNA pseudouridine(55) synthase TruB [Acetobacterium sp. K1/6]
MEKIKSYSGYLNVYKEKGMTSHDVVFKARKILKTKKIGHTGTLDPDAQGVLVLCVGQATKMVEYITDYEKVYEAEVILGIETDTCDLSGTVISENHRRINRDDFERILNKFIGDIRQKPPIYSAIRVNGKKLYHYARNGESVEIPERDIHIAKISLLKFSADTQKARIMVTCSKGTYIRSLCRDIGSALGTLGCMGNLIRHRVGRFSINDAVTLAEIEEINNRNQNELFFYPLEYSLERYQLVRATEQGRKFLLNGNKLFQWNVHEALDDFYPGETLRLYDGDQLIGMGRYHVNEEGNYIKPTKLL